MNKGSIIVDGPILYRIPDATPKEIKKFARALKKANKKAKNVENLVV